jgi:hypothetical protein
MLNSLREELLEKVILYARKPLILNHYTWRVSKQVCRVFFKHLAFEDLVKIPPKFLVPTVLHYKETNPESDKLRLCLCNYLMKELGGRYSDPWPNRQAAEPAVKAMASVIKTDWFYWLKQSKQWSKRERKLKAYISLYNPDGKWLRINLFAFNLACDRLFSRNEAQFRRIFDSVSPTMFEIQEGIRTTKSPVVLKVLLPLVQFEFIVEVLLSMLFAYTPVCQLKVDVMLEYIGFLLMVCLHPKCWPFLTIPCFKNVLKLL